MDLQISLAPTFQIEFISEANQIRFEILGTKLLSNKKTNPIKIGMDSDNLKEQKTKTHNQLKVNCEWHLILWSIDLPYLNLDTFAKNLHRVGGKLVA